MDAHGWIAIGTLVVATILFVTKRLPIAVTALSIPVVLLATGVLPDARDALRGMGSPAVLAIGAIFVLGTGLRESGVATLIARLLQRVGGRSEASLVAVTMVATAALSAFMSNAAVVAMLLPVSMVLCRRAKIAPSRLLMPMAFAAVLGGTITILGTAANIVVEAWLHDADLGAAAPNLGVFDFAPIGVAVTIVGTFFMVFLGRRLLPVHHEADRVASARLPEDIAESFRLSESLLMFGVTAASKVLGKTLDAIDLPQHFGMVVLRVRRPAAMADRWLYPDPELTLELGDRIYAQGDETAAWNLAEEQLLQFGLAGPRAVERILGRGSTLAEVAVSPRSRLVGHTLEEIAFVERYALQVLALWRADGQEMHDPLHHRLDVGDCFLVSGAAKGVHVLEGRPDYTVLTDQSQVEDRTRAPLALALLALALVPAILGWLPLAISALGGALLMVITGCVTSQGIRRALDWNVLALIAGTLPLGLALARHGVAAGMAEGIVELGAPLATPGVLGLLFVASAMLSVFASNAASAVIMSPVAYQISVLAGLDLQVTLLAVAYGCSCAFILPFAQWNLLVAVPGGYRTRDYLKVGGWMSLVMAVTVITLLSLMA